MKIIVDNLIFEALKPSEFRYYMKFAEDKVAISRVKEIWSKLQAQSIGSNRNGDRLYFNITEKIDSWDLKEIPISIKINEFFKQNGFEIVDVKNNKAKNLKDGRIISIMKVLESLRKIDPIKVQAYIKVYEFERSLMLDKQDKIMVISKSAYDLAGMSTGREFDSCLNIRDGVNKMYVPREIMAGTLVSYLINPDDRNINKPYARILIKPYLEIKNRSNVLYGIEHDIIKYGKRDPEYVKAVINLLDEAQGEKVGVFKINDSSLYDFGEKVKAKQVDVDNLSTEEFLKHYDIYNYIINPDNTIDVIGNVDLKGFDLKKISVKFNYVKGSFDCSFNNLTSLENTPNKVDGDFNCSENKLKSLKGGPSVVGRSYICNDNQLTSLIGLPSIIEKDFFCHRNELSSFEGISKKINGNVNMLNQMSDVRFTEEEIREVCSVRGYLYV